MSIESLIDGSGHECSILSATQQTIQTSLGGVNRSATLWSEAVAGVPCLVRVTGSSLNLGTNDKMSNQVYAKIYLASDPVPGGLTIKHRIEITAAGRGSRNILGVWNILSVIDPNGMGDHVEVGCERLASG